MAGALDDPYSSYLNKPAAVQLNQMIPGSFEGIGATPTMKNDLPIVAESPIEHSLAAEVGIKINDVILKIDQS